MLARMLFALSALLLLLPTPAHANGYLVARPGDWLRYAERGDASDTVTTRIELTEAGGWAMWSDFAGLGATWLATESDNEWVWIWDGSVGQPLANLDASVGSSWSIEHLACNRGTVRIGSRPASLSTPAGTFTDVVRLAFTRKCADEGVVSVWLAKGVGVVQWSQRSPSGLKTYRLQAAQVRGHDYPAGGPPTTTERAVAPSEHAQMESILWGADDTYLVLDTYRDAFKGLHGSGATVEVYVGSQGVASQLRYEMTQDDVPLDEVEFIVAPLDTVWMRDYGPIVLKTASGQRSVADLRYFPDRTRDDRIPRAYASYRGWSRVSVSLDYEGGNFATDGKGTAISSRGVLWFNDDKTRSQVERELKKLGCDRVVFVEPLKDEPTTHIDMFARVMNDQWALVSRYPAGHRQEQICDDAATAMEDLGYRVKRVTAASSYDEFATYSNCVLANGRALVPQYGVASRDRAALRAYRDLGYQAIGIDSKLIIKYAGATHCLSMQVPRGN